MGWGEGGQSVRCPHSEDCGPGPEGHKHTSGKTRGVQ